MFIKMIKNYQLCQKIEIELKALGIYCFAVGEQDLLADRTDLYLQQIKISNIDVYKKMAPLYESSKNLLANPT